MCWRSALVDVRTIVASESGAQTSTLLDETAFDLFTHDVFRSLLLLSNAHGDVAVALLEDARPRRLPMHLRDALVYGTGLPNLTELGLATSSGRDTLPSAYDWLWRSALGRRLETVVFTVGPRRRQRVGVDPHCRRSLTIEPEERDVEPYVVSEGVDGRPPQTKRRRRLLARARSGRSSPSPDSSHTGVPFDYAIITRSPPMCLCERVRRVHARRLSGGPNLNGAREFIATSSWLRSVLFRNEDTRSRGRSHRTV